MNVRPGLSAKELLTEVYAELSTDGHCVTFSKEVSVVIADDSDWHRIRQGYTFYESATIVKVGGRYWCLALGVAGGAYPAHPYCCDIAAVTTSASASEEELRDALLKNAYYKHSPVYAMSDGAIMTGEHFAGTVTPVLQPHVTTMVAKPRAVVSGVLTLDLLPVVKSATKYKPEFVPIICDVIRAALSSDIPTSSG